MREIAFDTETTGLDWRGEDRVIEVGCVEMSNHVATGKTLRRLINPGRAVSDDTVRITGITDDMLADKPPFEAIADELMEFIGDAVIVAHNAAFDRGFLNAELSRLGRAPVPEERWVDTVAIARARYPGAPASLDALCKRFEINTDIRDVHGALIDARLLADVYLELRGGRARSFSFEDEGSDGVVGARRPARQRPGPRPVLIREEERAVHMRFIETLGGEAGPLWRRLARSGDSAD